MPHARIPHTALVVIDMIGDFAFPGGAALARRAQPVAHAIADLKRRLGRHGVPTIYANDNYGHWRSDFRDIVARCGGADSLGAPVVDALRPTSEDYFVIKPRHSAFYGSPLEMLLDSLDVRVLVLAGMAGDRCVLATAADAHMRGFRMLAPADCVLSESAARHRRWQAQLSDAFGTTVLRASQITPARLRRTVHEHERPALRRAPWASTES
ncbi:cysteine hydrolase family protein [Coralloluteibacterium stylophorae]|uniref:Cysteine hydrolase n=1 Tax=Coralloluteibacterium stylophorae TaxID=1776034 RepID=A0A8J7VTV0_9GAMM|nr:isochorismatase family cysteine hydrolase [Coralloluteibacterium stylophorae]MBS7456984.1 cysteine hydrolase [Coralloluteibacterium stylophorae]